MRIEHHSCSSEGAHVGPIINKVDAVRLQISLYTSPLNSLISFDCKRLLGLAHEEHDATSISFTDAQSQLIKQVADAALELAEPYRTAILMRFFEAMTPNQIARDRELPVATVHTHLRRGLQLLRTRLDEVVDDTTNWRAILMVQPATASLLKLALSALLFTSLGVGGYALYDNVTVSKDEQARAQAGTTDPTLEPTGDALLDELRALCRDGSVEELIEERNKLHHCVLTRYQDDPVLWTGIERLAEIILQRPDCPDRLAWSRLIAKLIEDGGEPSEHLLDLVPRLRSVR